MCHNAKASRLSLCHTIVPCDYVCWFVSLCHTIAPCIYALRCITHNGARQDTKPRTAIRKEEVDEHGVLHERVCAMLHARASLSHLRSAGAIVVRHQGR